MRYIFDLTEKEIRTWVEERKFPKYRGDQILQWLAKGVESFEDMVNIPATIKNELYGSFHIGTMTVFKKHLSDDGTVKYLFKLHDGNYIESVLMKYSYGYSICVSTQVGCKMACSFCASGKGGFTRNLSCGEILYQILGIRRDSGKKISHTVVMGTGEPLDNYDNLVKFIHQVNNPNIGGIGMRKITVSTCGLIPEMLKFAREGLPVTLSVSLHGATDEIRSKLMPVGKKYVLKDLLSASGKYVKMTGRRITFEYILLKGMNDSPKDAAILAEKLRGMLCHVNLIPANEFEGCGFTRSSGKDIQAFKKILSDKGINVTIRRELGKDIYAACGHLRGTSV